MDSQTKAELLRVNRRFYEQVACHFDAARQGWPPGLFAILPYIKACGKDIPTVLDVGCGNGRFARLLAQQGFTVSYTGVDGNAQLLRFARDAASGLPGIECRFIEADLADPNWTDALKAAGRSGRGCAAAAARRLPAPRRQGPARSDATPAFDVVLCAATVQHMPGYALRLRLLRDFRRLSAKYIILSFWQFLSYDRFRARLVDPSALGIRPSALEPGDSLLLWRQGVEAIRFVHQVDETELRRLAADAELSVLRHFRADGKETDLNLYAILSKAIPSLAVAESC